MVNYLGQSQRHVPVNVLFQWTEYDDAHFQKLQESISSDACLMSFDNFKVVTLQVDASQVLLGAVSFVGRYPG